MGVIEKKILGALLILANDDMEVKATFRDIAKIIGYKEVGGAMTFAIKLLEINNYINVLGKGKYKVLV